MMTRFCGSIAVAWYQWEPGQSQRRSNPPSSVSVFYVLFIAERQVISSPGVTHNKKMGKKEWCRDVFLCKWVSLVIINIFYQLPHPPTSGTPKLTALCHLSVIRKGGSPTLMDWHLPLGFSAPLLFSFSSTSLLWPSSHFIKTFIPSMSSNVIYTVRENTHTHTHTHVPRASFRCLHWGIKDMKVVHIKGRETFNWATVLAVMSLTATITYEMH